MEVFEYPPILTGSVEEQLAYTVGVADEEDFGVGFRKGSDLTQKLNERQEGGAA